MGTAYFAECSNCCLSRRLRVGSTRISHAQKCSYYPAICNTCKTLVEANVWKEPFVCSKCQGTDVVIYGDQTRDPMDFTKYRNTTDGEHLCPHCTRYTLRLSDLGLLTD